MLAATDGVSIWVPSDIKGLAGRVAPNHRLCSHRSSGVESLTKSKADREGSASRCGLILQFQDFIDEFTCSTMRLRFQIALSRSNDIWISSPRDHGEAGMMAPGPVEGSDGPAIHQLIRQRMGARPVCKCRPRIVRMEESRSPANQGAGTGRQTPLDASLPRDFGSSGLFKGLMRP
jgi:hypothetical protein